MLTTTVAIACVLLAALPAVPASEATVGGTLKSISADRKQITVTVGSGASPKDETFRIATRTRIAMDGLAVKIDDLVVGTKVTLTYDKTSREVVSIRVAKSETAAADGTNPPDGVKVSDGSGKASSGPASELEQRCQQLCEELTKSYKGANPGKKPTVAVVEFSDLSEVVSDLGRLVSEELITKLFSTGNYKVIERRLLNKAITEHKLQLQRLVDPNSAKELGKILGVDSIVSGTIADRGDSFRLNARLISTETGEVFSVAAVTIRNNEALASLAAPSKPKTANQSSTVARSVPKGQPQARAQDSAKGGIGGAPSEPEQKWQELSEQLTNAYRAANPAKDRRVNNCRNQ